LLKILSFSSVLASNTLQGVDSFISNAKSSLLSANLQNLKPIQRLNELSDTEEALLLETANLTINEKILKEDLTLIIGDSITPTQVIPGISQRLGRYLDLKVPAFDLISLSTSFTNFCNTMNSWDLSEDSNILFSSINQCSTRYNFNSEIKYYLNDCAASVLVSNSDKFNNCFYIDKTEQKEDSLENLFVLPTFSTLEIKAFNTNYLDAFDKFFSTKVAQLDKENSAIILPEINTKFYKHFKNSLIYKDLNILSSFKNDGFSFGSSSLNTLSNYKNKLDSFKHIEIFEYNPGSTFGYTKLTKE